MIRLSRLDGSEIYLNAEHIQLVESTPDTHILLTNGQRYLVRETSEMVAELAVTYQRRVHRALELVTGHHDPLPFPSAERLPDAIDDLGDSPEVDEHNVRHSAADRGTARATTLLPHLHGER